MNFLKIKEKLINKKTLYIWLFIFLFFYFSDFVFAAEDDTSTIDLINKLIWWINAFIALISTALWVLTWLVSWFLSPEWYNWKIFWLDLYFREIWILVSNIAYTIFAIVLIVIAFMNIIWRWDKWELKQALPRFVIWVLIVPLSWFIIQFTLSISAVLTTSVIALPYEIFSDYEDEIWEQVTWEIDTYYVIKLWKRKKEEWDICAGEERTPEEQFISCNPQPVKDILTWNLTWDWNEGSYNNQSIFWLINVFSYAIMHIDKWDTVNQTQLQTIEKIWDLLQKSTFDAIFALIYFVLLIALFLALLVRWITVWIYTMFSPMFWLLYFFWKSKDWVWDGQMKFWFLNFIKLALVPVYVVWALSFGLVFLFVAVSDTSNSQGKLDTDNCLLSGWVFKLCLEWDLWDTTKENFLVWKGLMWRLIIEIFGLVILWIWIMAALKSSEITWKIISPIEDFGKQVWWLIMRSPMYAPIIPTGWGKHDSIWAITNAWKQFVSTLQHLPERRWQELFESHNPFSTWKSAVYSRLAIDANTIRSDTNAKDVWEKIKKVWTIEEFAKDYKWREWLAKVYEQLVKDWKIKDKDDLIRQLRNSNSVSDLKNVISKLEKGVEKQYRLFDENKDNKITFNEVSDGFWSKSSSSNSVTTEKSEAVDIQVNNDHQSWDTIVNMIYWNKAGTDTYTINSFDDKDNQATQLASDIAKKITQWEFWIEDIDRLKRRLEKDDYKGLEGMIKTVIEEKYKTYKADTIQDSIKKVEESQQEEPPNSQ